MSATEKFRSLAESCVDDMLAADPVSATWLGDHRFDDRLPDWSDTGALVRRIDDRLTELDGIDDLDLDVDDLVDLEILRSNLMHARFGLAELRSLQWNPMEWNPGTGIYLLVSRDTGDADATRERVRGRLAAVPDFLAQARTHLTDMPRIHVETSIAQLAGTVQLIRGDAKRAAEDDAVAESAAIAVEEFAGWLQDRLPDAHRSPRLGSELYSAQLWHSLDDALTPAQLHEAASAHLDLVGEQLREAAAAYLGESADSPEVVRRALDAVAMRHPVTNDTVLPLMVDAVERTRAFVIERDLVAMPQVETTIIEMPEIHRGVAVAYCDAPGPLEQARIPTFVAVSPTPADWSSERVSSFYREYNAVQLHDLAIHEAMPGHVLQLAHAQSLHSPTRVRRFGRSGVFIEGWAVYAEEVMIERGYTPLDDPHAGLAIRLQQLKMQARMSINAILDVGVHSGDLQEEQALALMRDRGFQEEGEAVGKWRRALLTSGQLPTYFVGYRAVRELCQDLRVMHADWSDRQVHDTVLAHGSPAPRHLRTLIGI